MVTLAGVLLFHLARQMLKGPPSLGSFSCPVLVCVESEAIETAPPPVCNSALSPCLHVCLACFLIIISSLISPQAIFPQSTADLALRLLTNIYAQLPAAEQSRGLASLSRVCVAVARVICDSYSIQTVTDQLLHSPTASNSSPLSQTVAFIWDITAASVATP